MTSIADAGAGLAIIGVGLLGLLIDFIPAIVGRKKRNATAIFALNLPLGCTVRLCLRPYSRPRRFSVAVAEYSAPGSQFCNSCGGKFISKRKAE
jgi:hypothetical protein